MKQHKHAAILKAIADGITVQYRETPDSPYKDQDSFINPFVHHEFEWRIKPKEVWETAFEEWFNNTKEIEGEDGMWDYDLKEVYKAGFIRGVFACQNGEYY